LHGVAGESHTGLGVRDPVGEALGRTAADGLERRGPVVAVAEAGVRDGNPRAGALRLERHARLDRPGQLRYRATTLAVAKPARRIELEDRPRHLGAEEIEPGFPVVCAGRGEEPLRQLVGVGAGPPRSLHRHRDREGALVGTAPVSSLSVGSGYTASATR